MTSQLDPALPDDVFWAEGLDGRRAIHVRTDACRAVVQEYGAHVTEFVPAGRQDMLWLSPLATTRGKAIRGGVPVCFPWFGPGISGQMEPAHGLARLVEWRLVAAGADEGVVTLTWECDGADVAGVENANLWPDGLSVRYEMELSESLNLKLTAINAGAQELRIEEALHTYVRVNCVADVTITGVEGHEYLDQVGDERQTFTSALRFHSEVDDIVDVSGRLVIEEPGHASVLVDRVNSGSAVLWNPYVEKAARLADLPDDAWNDFVCVEAANVCDHAVRLAPGETHTMGARYSYDTGM